MSSLFGLDSGELADLGTVLTKSGLDASMARRLIKNPELAQQWVAQLQSLAATDLKWNLFCGPQNQLRLLQRWNEVYKLGFTSEQFEALGSPPSEPKSLLMVVVLAWSLDTVSSTAKKAWQIARDQQGSDHWEGMEHLQATLAEGIGFTPNKLEWQIIDLGADQHTEIDGTWYKAAIRATNRAHSQVLQAAAYFPRWVKELGTEHVPAVCLAGYRVAGQIGGKAPLALQWHGRGGGCVSLAAMPFHGASYALPTCLK